MMLMVLPIPRSFGDSHSFTSSSDTSITPAGKFAANTTTASALVICYKDGVL